MENESLCPSRMRFSVLVVDRHEVVRSSLARRLRHASTVSWVGEAATLDQAMRSVDCARPDVVLLDPGGWDGDWRLQLATLTSIRSQGSTIALHVVRLHDGYANEARHSGRAALS